MKTIFITSFQPFISRNILDTKIPEMLIAQDSRLVIFVPKEKETFFREHFVGSHIVIEGIDAPAFSRSRMTKFFHNLSFLFIDSHYIRYVQYDQFRQHRSVGGLLRYRIQRMITAVFSRSTVMKWLFRKIDLWVYPKSFFALYFEKYNPDLIFAPDIYTDLDQALVGEAQQRGVVAVGMIRSWDNNYSKGLCRYRPDWLLVNNEGIKEEAVRMHGFKSDKITVVGLPQFDDAVSAPFKSRESFFKDMGADPEKRMVLISPAGFPLVPRNADEQLCEILQNAQRAGQIPDTVQFLVRSHPHRPVILEHSDLGKQFIIESKSTSFAGGGKWAEFSHKDKEHLLDSLYYADAVIWVATSLCLDALIFDKPQILANFDGYKNKSYEDSVVRYSDEDHLRRFLDTGAAKIAQNPDQMVQYLNEYLVGPTRDADKRRRGFDQQIGIADGKAGERIAHFLIKHL